jgi:hypothetical protein
VQKFATRGRSVPTDDDRTAEIFSAVVDALSTAEPVPVSYG